jgi:S-DNA-T family DNA segregation ATPase FtsK/SpoIIIE
MAKKVKENKLIFGEVEEFPENDKEEKPKKSKEKPAEKGKYFSFLKDERFLKSTGLIFILFSLLLFISSISFFTTWQEDQSLVKSITFGMLEIEQPTLADNILGNLGAWLSYIFVYKGFGIASFAFVLLFFLVGVLLLTGLQPLPLAKTLRFSFFGGIWLSMVLGFIFNESYPVAAGAFGHFGFLYLQVLLGSLGTALLLTTYLLIFLVLAFNIKFYGKLQQQAEDEDQNKNVLKNLANVSNSETNAVENIPLNLDDFILVQKEINSPEPMPAEAHEVEVAVIEETPAYTLVEINNPEQEEFEPTEAEEQPEEEILNPIEIIEVPGALTTNSGLILEVQDQTEDDLISEEQTAHVPDLNTPYDPTLDFSRYQFPTLELLNEYGDNKGKVESAELSEKTRMIEDTLKNYGIGIKKISATIGPTVTLYEIIPQDGVRIAKIKNLEDDIALSLAALGIRIIAPIPGRGTIGIEVPNSVPAMVSMKSVLASSKFVNAEMDLPIGFGKTISNEVFVADLAKMPHLLMAGATGQGKSVGLNAILVSLLYKKHPSQIKFVLVDPKKVELNIYKTIERHFLAKIPGDQDAIITDTKLVVHTLNSLCKEMDDRYDLLKDAQVRNLREYNAKFISRRLPPTDKIDHRFLPYIVVVIDELADLMMTAGKEVEHPIARLAQLARAIGIHLILATQRPSVNIITGTIKANFPARVAFRVSQKIDSRTILDANGADQLIGKGDMLFSNGNDLIRLQCAFVDTPEVEKITEFIGNQPGREPYLLPLVQTEGDDSGISEGFDHSNRDELFEDAARIIVVNQQGSTSLLQRRLNLGYNRAGRLIDQLEKAGIVGPFKGSKAREVLMHTEAELDEHLKNLI